MLIALVDEAGGCGEELLGLADVARNRLQGLRRVLGAEAGQLLFGGRQPTAHLLQPSPQLGEELRHRGLEVPQPGELGLLLVEDRVRRPGELEDLLQPLAVRVLVEAAGPLQVVVLPLEPERLGSLGLGLLEGGPEPLRGLDAELGLGERELLRRRTDGVVDLHEGARGLPAQLVGRHGRRALRSPSPGSRALAPAGHGDECDPAGGQDQPPRREATAGATLGPLRRAGDVAGGRLAVPLGGRAHRAGPVVVGQLRLDEVRPDDVVLLRRQAGVRRGVRAVSAVLDGHSQEHVVAPHARLAEGLLRPGLATGVVEAVDVDHEQLEPVLGPEVVEHRLQVLDVTAQHPGTVGELVGDVERRVGGQRRSTGR